MSKTKILSYVRLITDESDEEYGMWNAVCITELGTLFRCKRYSTEAEAKQEAFQNIKLILNSIFEDYNWYELIEVDPNAPEIDLAFERNARLNKKESLYEKTSFNIHCLYIKARFRFDLAMLWVRYFIF